MITDRACNSAMQRPWCALDACTTAYRGRHGVCGMYVRSGEGLNAVLAHRVLTQPAAWCLPPSIRSHPLNRTSHVGSCVDNIYGFVHHNTTVPYKPPAFFTVCDLHHPLAAFWTASCTRFAQITIIDTHTVSTLRSKQVGAHGNEGSSA